MEAINDRKLECILLIDDNEFTNIFNRRFLEKSNMAKEIFAVKSGEEALEFLLRKGKYARRSIPDPELILLDLNMPVMSGWEFIDEFEKLDVAARKGKIIILTTSPNPEDEERAQTLSMISDYCKKPLTREMLSEIIRKHFS